MRALRELKLVEAPEPVPGPGEVLVEVRHVSANHSELKYPHIGGHDAAGIIVEGQGKGGRVVAFGAGAWAERAVFPASSVAAVPDGVDLADAAALPMAGLTALRTLRAAGPLLGRRVLITGASGGVGRLAVQLAHRAGAHVIAAARRGEGLRELGADEVLPSLDGVEPVDVVLELLGGPHLVRAWELLAPGGNLQSIGWSSGEPAAFTSLFALGAARSIHSFGDVSEPGPDLATLVDLVDRGLLSPSIGWRGPWERAGEAADALFSGQVRGKIVLDVT
ncbi:zinc-binding dehydrogenase [Nonomuraea sp. NPDC049152]|uniref:zinc-binding dehydrogenase n=1 Tax=Nonomuraea sp. NPDC049152 TaxID=3154350 RepID=UPI0033E8310D